MFPGTIGGRWWHWLPKPVSAAILTNVAHFKWTGTRPNLTQDEKDTWFQWKDTEGKFPSILGSLPASYNQGPDASSKRPQGLDNLTPGTLETDEVRDLIDLDKEMEIDIDAFGDFKYAGTVYAYGCII